MRIVRPSGEPDDPAIAEAAEIIRRGGVVAFPTETVYGLGANALDRRAVARIFEAKGRPSYNPLIVHVAGREAAAELVSRWDERATLLAERFWPGPLTLVLPKSERVPPEVTAGLGTVAVRVPNHPIALALLAASGVPLAAPSANRSTELSPTAAAHVARSLGDRIDLILDGGMTRVGIESTVIDLSVTPAVLLRPGSVSIERLRELIAVEFPGDSPETLEARPSPGMMERHYAPRAQLRLFDSGSGEEALAEARRDGVAIGAVVRGEALSTDMTLALPGDPEEFARMMYAALHRIDEAGCGIVLVEAPPADSRWDAIRDRLTRAGSPAR